MLNKLLELLLPVFIARNEVRILAPLRALDKTQNKPTEKEELK